MNDAIRVLLVLACTVLAAPVAAAGDAQKPLNLKVFTGPEDHMGLGVGSAIIYGEKEAIVIDAQYEGALNAGSMKLAFARRVQSSARLSAMPVCAAARVPGSSCRPSPSASRVK